LGYIEVVTEMERGSHTLVLLPHFKERCGA
jgi:hypothetical protein